MNKNFPLHKLLMIKKSLGLSKCYNFYGNICFQHEGSNGHIYAERNSSEGGFTDSVDNDKKTRNLAFAVRHLARHIKKHES